MRTGSTKTTLAVCGAGAALCYSVAVSGPVVWHTGRGGFPVKAQPLPVEMYVAPGRYGA